MISYAIYSVNGISCKSKFFVVLVCLNLWFVIWSFVQQSNLSKFKGDNPFCGLIEEAKKADFNNTDLDVAFLVTFGVKTSGYPECTLKVAEGIKAFYPEAKILIADDGNTTKAQIPNKLKKMKNVEYHILPFDSGLSYGRNYLVGETTTPFFVLMDDDFVFTNLTKIEVLLGVLLRHDLHIVGAAVGDRVDFYKNFVRKDDLLLLFKESYGEVSHDCKVVDMITNFFVARTTSLLEVPWDNAFKLGEHEDFFLRFRDKYPFKVAFCAGVHIEHEQLLCDSERTKENTTYFERRNRAESFLQKSMEKHHVRGIAYMLKTKWRMFGNITDDDVFQVVESRQGWIQLTPEEALFPPVCSDKMNFSIVNKTVVKESFWKFCEDITPQSIEDIPLRKVYLKEKLFIIQPHEERSIYRKILDAVKLYNRRVPHDFQETYSRFLRVDVGVDPLYGTEYLFRLVTKRVDIFFNRTLQYYQPANSQVSPILKVFGDNPATIRIVIPVYNNFQSVSTTLVYYLKQIYAYGQVPFAVHLVDFGSTDGDYSQLGKELTLQYPFMYHSMEISTADSSINPLLAVDAVLNSVPHSSQEITFLVESSVIMRSDFLSVIKERVVEGKQVFVPAPFAFSEGNDDSSLKSRIGWNMPFIMQEAGKWKTLGFWSVAAYSSDWRSLLSSEDFRYRVPANNISQFEFLTKTYHAGYRLYRTYEHHYYVPWNQELFPPQVKIFVYDLPPQFNLDDLEYNQANLDIIPSKHKMGRDEWDCLRSIFSLEIHFHRIILQSQFITTDPMEADYFYVPSYSICHMNNYLPMNTTKLQIHHNELLIHLQKNYPYWNASNGHDHIFLISQGLGGNLMDYTMRATPSILTVNPDTQDIGYSNWKDIGIPPHIQDIKPLTPKERKAERPNRVFFGGAVKLWLPSYSKGVRQYIVNNYSNRTGWIVFSRTSNMNDTLRSMFVTAMKTSVFCLAPEGLFAFTPRISESLLCGCIPVIISDTFLPPFYDLVDYDTFSIRLPNSAVTRLPQILDSITDAEILRKQAMIRKLTNMFVYNNPPMPGDAFYTIMRKLEKKKKLAHKIPFSSTPL